MNKFIRYILPAVAIVFLLNSVATETSAQGVLHEILKRMDKHNKSMTSLKGKIKMSKVNHQLNETDMYEGSLSYLPGASQKQIYIRIDWEKPLVEHLAVANGKYVLYRPKANQAIVGNVDSAKGNAKTGGALAFMSMSRAQLSENYDVKYVGDETVNSGTKTFHLLLTPKKANGYKSADLWVDSDGMPVQAKVVEKNSDTTTVLLSNFQKNGTIKASDFKISPPKGTKVVEG